MENGSSDKGHDHQASDCSCTLEKVKKAIILMGPKEIEILISEDVAAEAKCEFCGRMYSIGILELKKLLVTSQNT